MFQEEKKIARGDHGIFRIIKEWLSFKRMEILASVTTWTNSAQQLLFLVIFSLLVQGPRNGLQNSQYHDTFATYCRIVQLE